MGHRAAVTEVHVHPSGVPVVRSVNVVFRVPVPAVGDPLKSAVSAPGPGLPPPSVVTTSCGGLAPSRLE